MKRHLVHGKGELHGGKLPQTQHYQAADSDVSFINHLPLATFQAADSDVSSSGLRCVFH